MIAPAECWIVQPPDPPRGFFELVGYLLNAGVDVAFGPDDALPDDLPPNYDGIRCIAVCSEDLPRLRTRLRGFRGLDPDSEEPACPPSEGERSSHGSMYLHADDRTWLAVYTESGRLNHKRIENPLIIASDLTVNSPRLRERMLARPDRQVHRQLLEALMTSDRHEWSDVSFGTLWAMIGAYEATGEVRYREAARAFAETQLERSKTSSQGPQAILTSALSLLRLSEITGDLRYREALLSAVPKMPDLHHLRTRGGLHLQALSFVHPATSEYLISRAADGGTYSEQVGLPYPSVLATSKAGGWVDEAADRIAQCLAEHRANCRDE